MVSSHVDVVELELRRHSRHSTIKARRCAIAQDGEQDKTNMAVGFWMKMGAEADEKHAGSAQIEEMATKLNVENPALNEGKQQ